MAAPSSEGFASPDASHHAKPRLHPVASTRLMQYDAAPTPKDKEEAKEQKLEALGDTEDELALARSTDGHNGLSVAEAEARFAKYGPNELKEKKKSAIMQFLGYLWGPMPIMIWLAIIIEFAKGLAVGEGWEDFAVLMVLQFANAVVGYIEEKNAGDAIAALKAKLAPQAHVCRDGRWGNMPARNLVPGDLIELKIGDVIPADAILRDCKPVQVDQAALTGESLPVTKSSWEKVLMGSALKQGEAHAVVVATGSGTFFGKAADMINAVVTHGRLQTVLLRITMSLLVLSVVLCVIIFIKLMVTTINPYALREGNSQFMGALSIMIVILVASIPVAIEVVCTSTLALGSHQLSAKGIIVARLSAIEELAGMTVLCSDKTGTLTKNKLELQQPIVLADAPPCDIVFYAALASKRAVGNQDAIDFAICDSKSNRGLLDEAIALRGLPLSAFKEVEFEPFNPIDKRTLARVALPEGGEIEVAKGAPMVVLKMAHNRPEIDTVVRGYVQDLADRGFRALGVAINLNPPSAPEKKWQYLGILSIFDPPRDDTKATIAAAIDNGIAVKMVTGDHGAIAKETCRALGMGSNILNTEVLDDKDLDPVQLDATIMECDGFAEVMPEHKFAIVERIRALGHVTGMTGDGVNDAPALKRADVGIAVAGATDAARAAADLVLTEEGLSVIIDAIFESRKIFQRMRNYIIYRIACTIQLLCFFFFASIAVDPDHETAYNKVYDDGDMKHTPQFTLPVIALVIITILNDGCMITISKDRVLAEKKPQKWAMKEIWIVALVLGFVACLSSLIMLAYMLKANALHRGDFFGLVFGSQGRDYLHFEEIRCIIYLKISVSDFLTLFSARTRTWFWERAIGLELGIAALIATSTSTLFALFWGDFVKVNDAPMSSLYHSDGAAAATWMYCLLWWFAQDVCKIGTYALMEHFKPAAEKEVETFARRHSAEYLEKAPAHGAAPVSAAAPGLLPQGTDLTALAKAAANESLKGASAKTVAAASDKKAESAATMAALQAGAAPASGSSEAAKEAPV